MTEFEPPTSGVRRNSSTNWATTTVNKVHRMLLRYIQKWFFLLDTPFLLPNVKIALPS